MYKIVCSFLFTWVVGLSGARACHSAESLLYEHNSLGSPGKFIHTPIRGVQLQVVPGCHDNATRMPRECHESATTAPRQCHDSAMTVSRECHESAMKVPRQFRDFATRVPRQSCCHCAAWIRTYDQLG